MQSPSVSDAEKYSSSCHHSRFEKQESNSDENIYRCGQCSGIFKLTIEIFSSSNSANDEPTIDSYNESQETQDNDNADEVSRLKREFEFVEKLGSGGFGDVCKYRNKLDQQLYAIKRIKLTTSLTDSRDNKDAKIKREIHLLSGLDHENIVRYYNCWVEDFDSFPITQR